MHRTALIIMTTLLATAPAKDALAQAAAQTEVTLVERFFDALSAEDVAQLDSLADMSAQVILPYNPNGDASDAGIRRFPLSGYVRTATRVYDSLRFTDRVITPAERGTVWVEAEGQLVVAATGKPYNNRYVFKFETGGGRIIALTEYTNTVTLARDGVAARPQQ